MLKTKIVIIGLMCLSVFQMNAQAGGEDVSSISLSLREAQDYAIEHNRTLKNASIDIQKAEANHWMSISTMLPQANGSVDYSNMFGYQIELGPGQVLSMPSSIQLGVGAAVSVSGAQIVSLELTKIAQGMADVSLNKTEQDITSQVKVLYYSALVTEQTIVLLKKNLKNLEDLYSFSQKSVEVGVSEQIDADQILVQVATLKTSLNNTQRSRQILYNSIRLLLNINYDVEVILTQKMMDLQADDRAMSLLEQEFVIANNYDFQLVQGNVDVNKQQVKLAGWAYGPSLSLFYQYTYRSYIGSEGGFNTTPPNMLGMGLKIPIFSSGNKRSALKNAKLEYQKQLNVLEDTEDAMRIQHSQLSYNLTSAYERYQTQLKNVEVTQRVFDNISKKYEYGMASSLDVTTSGTNLITAQNGYVQAILEFVTAQIDLEKLLNK